jgi:histidinol-phosphate aminotransferase
VKILQRAKPWIANTPLYIPGKPIETVARESGLDLSKIVKLASNENPLGPSPLAVAAATKGLQEAHRYPDGGNYALRQALAQRHHLEPNQFVFGNGSNEVLEFVAQTFLEPGDNIVVGQYAFVVYRFLAIHFGADVKSIPMPGFRHDFAAMRAAIDAKTKIVFLASPNNPTGAPESAAAIYDFAASLPEDVIFCFDEAYAEYLDEPADLRPLIAAGRPILCFRTFSKIFGLGSLRLGYAYGPRELVHFLEYARQPFNTNGIAQAAGLAALSDHAFVERSREINAKGLIQLTDGLTALGCDVVPSAANFVLVKTGRPGDQDAALLQKEGIIVRPVGGYGLPDYLRVSVGTPAENQRFLEVYAQILEGRSD